MGLFKFLKEKFAKKNNVETNTYVKGMEKSRANFASKLDELSLKYKSVNQDYFDSLEEILIEADVGVNLTIRLIEEVLEQSKQENIKDPKTINELLVDKMFLDYATKGNDIQSDIKFVENGVTVLLVCGVNGVGKTTSIAKLADRYINMGKKVVLAAADTFRAGATEQLQVWASRLSCPIVIGKPDSDPASVAYEGAKKAKEINADLLIVDTA